MNKTLKVILIMMLFINVSEKSFAIEKDIVVLLSVTNNPIQISGSNISLNSGLAGENISESYLVTFSNNRLNINDKLYSSIVSFSSENPININGKKYYGKIILEVKTNNILIKNVINSELYIEGVLASEMSYSWPIEALKAQAVVARTYLFSSKKHLDCDVCATTHCQVYNGIPRHRDVLNRATVETRGYVLMWNNLPASVFYHADSGGITTSSKNMWGSHLPYLNVTKEPFHSKNPNLNWSTNLSRKYIEEKLSNNGYNIGNLISIKPIRRDESARVTMVSIMGTNSSVDITGNKLRLILGSSKIKSTLFNFKPIYKNLPKNLECSIATQKKNNLNENIYIKLNSINTIEDRLAYLTNLELFTTEELMHILSTPDKNDEHIKLAMKRLETYSSPKQKDKTLDSNYIEDLVPYYGITMDSTANNANEIVFYGIGSGHGVGMSQWGARTLAESGWLYNQILNLYFKGTTLTQ